MFVRKREVCLEKVDGFVFWYDSYFGFFLCDVKIGKFLGVSMRYRYKSLLFLLLFYENRVVVGFLYYFVDILGVEVIWSGYLGFWLVRGLLGSFVVFLRGCFFNFFVMGSFFIMVSVVL